jgi:hypothetical protein
MRFLNMVISPFPFHLEVGVLIVDAVNELSTTIDLESTLIRAEALFRRFQRTVEAIDKKSNFPAPKLRLRPTPLSPTNSLGTTPGASANTSGVDAVTAGSTNSGSGARPGSAGENSVSAGESRDKGKRPASQGRVSGELEDVRPKVISPELRALLSRKVEVLPRKVVRKEGEGLASLKK